LLYQSQVGLEWFSAIRNEGFNTKTIEEEFLRAFTETINDQIRERMVEQV
jgi:hypothetical protein